MPLIREREINWIWRDQTDVRIARTTGTKKKKKSEIEINFKRRNETDIRTSRMDEKIRKRSTRGTETNWKSRNQTDNRTVREKIIQEKYIQLGKEAQDKL